ncbi:cortical protein marker for cell polarity-domain-containing protein [Melampsora americana]|nr:cortical protein marker for cell polarity-domain-containing protein [Melampsora americana]
MFSFSIIFTITITLTIIHIPTQTLSATTSSSLPIIDWSALGNVGLLGSFSGLSIYNASSSNSTFDSSHSTLISLDTSSQSDSQPLISLGSTNQGGAIHTICQSNNKLYIGGAFSTINSANPLSNVAVYDIPSKTFQPLAQGLDGPVYTISCNHDSNLIWIGGAFNSPIGVSDPAFGPNIITWSPSNSSWKPVPFVGLNGPVWSIQETNSKSGRSLILGGSFSVLIDSPNGTSSRGGIASSPTRANQAAQQAGAPANFTSLGSSLTPISLVQASVSAQPSTTLAGYTTPRNIFCPSGLDGPGNSWLLDGAHNDGLFTVNLGQAVQAGGIRLGNTFADGGATHEFQIVSIPDNTVLQLRAIDPITGQITTCQTNCTLARDVSIPYEDFLFPNGTTLTGFQIVIKSKYGNVAGFHLVQLLSTGNTAYAVGRLNADDDSQCKSGLGSMGGNSSSSTTGTWTEATTNANIPGTTKAVLMSAVQSGTSPNDGPSLSWNIFVAQSGIYDISVYLPGCQNMGDCDKRTQVNVAVQPLGAGSTTPTITKVDQSNQQDSSVVVYNGTLTATGQGGGVRITMRLAETAGRDVVIVADQAILRAHSSDGISDGILSHGLFEYVMSGTGAFGDGAVASTELNAASTATALKLTTTTAFDKLGAQFDPGVTVKSIVFSDPSTVFVSGDQLNASSSFGTVLRPSASSSAIIPNGGLNGDVDCSLILDGYLYVAGNFTSTVDRQIVELDGLARWHYSRAGSSWEPLRNGSGLIGPIVKLTALNNMIFAISSGAGTTQPSGRSMAAYDPVKSSWAAGSNGFLLGNLTAMLASGTSKLYLAGNIAGAASFAAPGGAFLSTGNRLATVTPLGFQMNQTATINETSVYKSMAINPDSFPVLSKRWVLEEEQSALMFDTGSDTGVENLVFGTSTLDDQRTNPLSMLSLPRSYTRRQTSTASPIQNSTPSFALISTQGAAILAGSFWKDKQVVLGGRFVSTGTSPVSNVGIYDQSAGTLSPLNGPNNLTGTVLALKVINETAWIGGSFISPSGKTGLDTYDLKEGKWVSDLMPSPQPYPNTNVSVRVIMNRPGNWRSDVVIGGSFGMLGSLPCQSICLRSSVTGQWQSLGNGLRGVVNAIDFSGKDRNQMIVGGFFNAGKSPISKVVKWDFDSTTMEWNEIGNQDSIPGIVKTLVTDGTSLSTLFIAGQVQTSGLPFLMRWDGNTWRDVAGNGGGGLLNGSVIEQLAFVPLKSINGQKTNVNGIENDRMLMVSGSLSFENQKSKISAALWDGSNWIPYFVTVDDSGKSGVVSKMISVADSFVSSARRFLSVGLVIVISMAISLGIVFFGVLLGLLIALKMRSKEANQPHSGNYSIEDEDEMEDEEDRGRPSSLLATIDAATAAMTDRMRNLQEKEKESGVAVGVTAVNGSEGNRRLMDDVSPIVEHSGERNHAGVGPNQMTMVEINDEDDEHLRDGVDDQGEFSDGDIDPEIDVRRARWSFDPQLPGEIGVGAGESVEIKDRSNPDWWLVRRADGVEGVIPADWFL